MLSFVLDLFTLTVIIIFIHSSSIILGDELSFCCILLPMLSAWLVNLRGGGYYSSGGVSYVVCVCVCVYVYACVSVCTSVCLHVCM
jgi:hypothetical protein